MLKHITNKPVWVGSIYLITIPIFGLFYYYNPCFWNEPLTAVQSIYFSAVTITTLGYGDITPQTDIARSLAAIESVFGIILIGLFLNAVAHASDMRREEKRNQAAKRHLLSQYQEWREDLVHACLRAAENCYSVDHETGKELVDFKKFRSYFSGDNNERWFKVLRGMQDDDTVIKDIMLLSELFSQQINSALGKVNTDNTKSLRILTRVSQESYRRLNLDVFSADPVKYIGQYMFEILGMWSTIDGAMNEDFIEKAINEL
jgi:hypothetical protein